MLGYTAFALAIPAPAAAQEREDNVVGPILERARDAYTPPEPEPERPADCVQSTDDTVIIVCAPIEDDPDQYRVTSRLEEGDDSHLEWTGQAPDVAGPGIFKGPATVSGCIKGVTCPPPPVYMIDFSELPEAPPGSDADRISRGLAPRGSRYDAGEEALEAAEQKPAGQESIETDPPEADEALRPEEPGY